jgi:hypothetical protein
MANCIWTGTTSGDWAVTTNWLGGAVPVAADDVYLTNSGVDITLSLNQSTITLNSLTVDTSFTGKIAAANTYLQINATTLNIGRQFGDQTGSGSQRLHFNGTYGTVNIIDAGTSSADSGFPATCLLGTITTLNVRAGRVGVAALTPSETATVTTLNVSQADNATSSPVVSFGGVTSTTLNLEAGTLLSKATATVTTANILGGTYRVDGTAAHTTIKAELGKLVYNGTGTITTLNQYNATVDFSNDPRSKTVTTWNAYANAKINLQTGVTGSVTVTNGIKVNGCDLDAITLKVGNDRTLSLS